MYGKKSENQETTSSTTSTQSPTESPTEDDSSDETRTEQDPDVKPDLCKNSKIDAITTLADGSVYAFQGISLYYNSIINNK
jgi:hypothetical protein